MQNTLNRIMLKTAAWTLGIVFGAFTYGCVLVSLIFPLQFSEFCDKLGATAAAAQHYERYYQQNPTPENHYLTLEKFIQSNNSEKVIQYFELLYIEKNNDYISLVDEVNEYLLSMVTSKNEFTFSANEDNRLKTAYISALLSRGLNDTAKLFYRSHCTSVDLQHPNRAFFAFLRAEKQELVAEDFKAYYAAFKTAYETDSESAEFTNNAHLRPLYFLTEAAKYLNDEKEQEYRNEYNSRPLQPLARGEN